ncbi:MAG: hypothetical protein AAGI68_02300 [Planctomycetota bacterium]
MRTSDQDALLSDTPARVPVGYWALLILLTLVVGWGLIYKLGQDISWDTRNYHLYNAYAVIHDRLDYDLAPASRQSYFNPALDIFHYVIGTAASPLAATLATATLQMLAVFAVFAIAFQLTVRRLPGGLSAWGVLGGLALLAAAGFASPMNVRQFGILSGDTVTAVPLLAGMVVLMTGLGHPSSAALGWRRVLLAGGLVGVSVGLKLTNASAALACLIAVLVCLPGLMPRLRFSLLFAVAGTLGVALSAGWWWGIVYAKFGNPIFPAYNHVFRSPELPAISYADVRYHVAPLWERLLMPFQYNRFTGIRYVNNLFDDFRLPLVILGCVAGLGTDVVRSFFKKNGSGSPSDQTSPADPRQLLARFLLVVAAVTYIAWAAVFAVPRYLLILELLAPVIMLAAGILIFRFRPATWIVTALGFLLIMGTISGLRRKDLRVPFHPELTAGVQPPQGIDFSNALMIMEGNGPYAYVIPTFPESARWVRIKGNLYPDDAWLDYGFGDRVRQIITNHQGPLYVIYIADYNNYQMPSLEHFSLVADTDQAFLIKTPKAAHDLTIHPLRRSDQARNVRADD